jgi:hypothetical protein
MSALAIIKEAADCGVRISLNGDSVALKAATNRRTRSPISKNTNPGLSRWLRQAAVPIGPAGYSDLEWLAAITDAKRQDYENAKSSS